jgi:hypothetical protein
MTQNGDENHAEGPKFHDDTEPTDNHGRQKDNKTHSTNTVVLVLFVLALIIAVSSGSYYYYRHMYRGRPINFR